jgi:hypothetical protein
LLARMFLAASTSEKSFNLYQTTRRNIPKDSHFHGIVMIFSETDIIF